MSIFNARLSTCGCCELPFPGTPAVIFNRPALDEIDYRVGTYGSFRQAMLRRTPVIDQALRKSLGLPLPPLARWTAREDDDYGVALFGLWATVADILTFYQERYANEAFLRTANQRESILRLAGLLGYRLSPGKAAATYLAFTLDDDTNLTIPAGLLTQSVPAEGEKPQKYETSKPFLAAATRNRIRVYNPPVDVKPLKKGRVRATLEFGAFTPSEGDRFVAYHKNKAETFEERTVESVETVDRRSVMTWSQPLRSSHSEAYTMGRVFQLFGHSAPKTYLTSKPSKTNPNLLEWKSEKTEYDFKSSKTLDLDGIVDGIETGSKVLVVSAGLHAAPATVTKVEQVTATIGSTSAATPAQSGSTTRLTLNAKVSGNVRSVRVYELGQRLDFQTWEISPEKKIPKARKYLYLPLSAPVLEKGDTVMVDDDTSGSAQVIELAGVATVQAGGSTVMRRLQLKDKTKRALAAGSAHVLANVAAASHGETIATEVVGDGDGATPLQSFELKKSPVTHVADATAKGGAASTLSIRVGGVEWKGRSGLYGAGAHDRVYTTSIDDDQKTTVQFGDGVTGARLPTGKANVVARYRQGLGKDGNVAAGQITTALDRPVGLKAVVNPVAASGGTDAETSAKARQNAPNTVRTFDRAVSLSDFEDLAREFVGVDKALATWVWTGETRTVHLTVAGDDGAALAGKEMANLRSYLDVRRDPNRPLLIAGYLPVKIDATVSVRVAANRLTTDVSAAVADAIEAYFDFDQRGFGEAVHLSDIYAEVEEVAGVDSALVTVLRYSSNAVRIAHGAGPEPVLVHLGISAARPPGTPHTTPTGAELAVLGALKVKASGGLAE